MEYNEEKEVQEKVFNAETTLRIARIRSVILWVLFTFIAIATVLLATEPLYFFNFLESDPNIPLSGQIFRFGFYLFVVATFVYMFWFSVRVSRYKVPYDFQEVEQIEAFKRHYSLFDLFMVVPVFLTFIIIVNGFFFGFAYVDGESMLPTYESGEFVVIEHYHQDYNVGDVIIIQRTDKLIKRVVAIGGDEVIVNASGVWVNGVFIEDSIRINSFYDYFGTLPEGFYFVMGDNRENSEDSRYFGPVSENQVLGEVIYPKHDAD
ncbi:MAG: signal peptidase I [Bacilli bacterium]|nr:signal peptidase I [Bacilli bacterium]MBN2696868.1 signal peptidase I [Bacilli bacterium]